jgi:hypothetical protein
LQSQGFFCIFKIKTGVNMPAYNGLAGGKKDASRINRNRKTRAAQRAQARANEFVPFNGQF